MVRFCAFDSRYLRDSGAIGAQRAGFIKANCSSGRVQALLFFLLPMSAVLSALEGARFPALSIGTPPLEELLGTPVAL